MISGSDHGSPDACTHAVDHYDHAVHSLSSDVGHAFDSIFGDSHSQVTAGDIGRDTMNVYGAHTEMEAACGWHDSSSGANSGWW